MEIRHFITFNKIVEQGSFTEAAHHLGYAQSTVTGHIQALEDELGNRLFDRVGKKVILTELGHRLLNHSRELLAVYERIQTLSSEKNLLQGVLRIGSMESLAAYRLGPIFREYKKKYPQMDIILKTGPWTKLNKWIHQGDLDLVFALENEIDEPKLTVKKLNQESMCFVFPPDCNPKTGNPFKNQTIIYALSYRGPFDNHLERMGVYPKNFMEIGSVETIKRCVASGIGVSFLPLFTVEHEIHKGQLSMLPWQPKTKGVVTQVVHHKNRWLSPAMEKLLEITGEHAKNW